MRLNSASNRSTRTSRGTIDLVNSWVNRLKIARKDHAEAVERLRLNTAGPTVQERQEELISFYNRYEELVETLCDAAQFGPTPKLEKSYGDQRVWMKSEYPKVRPFVGAYLRNISEEDFSVQGEGYSDAFEALVCNCDLASFLQTDDGHMISRITRTREALNLYGEHLRQLAARAA